jgi:hypothetical protein
MRKFIVHLNIYFVTDARDKDEARKIAEGICESKNINRRCYKIAQIFEARDRDYQKNTAKLD